MSNQAVAGYFAGGNDQGGTFLTRVDKFAFPSDTRTTLGTGLSAATRQQGGMSNAFVAGYFGGGSTTSSQVTTVDKFAFPGDTRSTLATGLSAARTLLAGNSNSGVL
jgi:hypothetical protein